MFYILKGVFAGTIAVIILVISYDNINRGNSAPAPVSESEGILSTIYIQFNKESALAVGNVYSELIRNIKATIYVGCPEQEDWGEFCRLIGYSDKILPVFTRKKTSTWSKDRFISVRRGGRLSLLVPKDPPVMAAGRADWLVAWDLASAVDADVRVLPIQFDGGDIWMCDEVSFASSCLMEKNPGMSREDLSKILEKEIGCRIIFVDGAPHHLGMFMTPIGNRTIMVGDPDRWRNLSETGDFSHEWLEKLRALPDFLRQEGFTVIAIPFVPLTHDKTYLTYNNVLIDGRNVFMPVYSTIEMDNEAERIWTDAGFRVYQIPAKQLYKYCGTIHCLVNILERHK